MILKKSIEEVSETELSQIKSILKPFYVDIESLVERELKLNNFIYLYQDKASHILGFFMVNFPQFNKTGNNFIYLGLSCASKHKKNIGFSLYAKFTLDAYQLEKEFKTKIYLYGTTATSTLLRLLTKVWSNLRPSLEGEYSQNDKVLSEKIKPLLNYKSNADDHPFVLKKHASKTLYSPAEKVRINAYAIKNKIRLFEKIGVCEEEGDRLLVILEIPDSTKIKEFQKMLNTNEI
ncbi:hypothetical protein G3567_02535 [Psychroflexus sp. YR1-1]|uniref:N-acetyltransferase domain-containing protein n=1 Tax=Psychroflexus aurantiacus TaxID=2709310 RepID=A0A6B3QXS5_9FLAO|nr:hypothetical protein [Psychroflexus aurantiacus]NEV93023.1 hypothetical protein [Psychroflexus aurantiacus]